MCGRFSLRARNAAMLAEFFGVVGVIDLPLFRPHYNIAPSQPVLAVRCKSGEIAQARNSSGEIVFLHWGLIPGWAKSPDIGNKMINVRADSLLKKPAFRAALQRRRCLVAADGFYEWKSLGKTKQPYFFRLSDDRPFAFAGLWDVWEGPAHSAVESCTIITTEANDLARRIHERMPVILPPEACKMWLDPALENLDEICKLLVSDYSRQMESHPVSSLVNSPAHDDPRCVEPVKDGIEQREFF